MSPTETQTPTFPAVTTRGLTFWAISFGGDGRRFPPGTRVSVTVLETGQHCMSTSAEGVTYSRFSSAYDTRSPLPEATATAEEIGGIGLGTMAASLTFPHGGEEVLISVFGVLVLALGHDLNRRAGL